METPNKLCFKK